MVATRKKTKAEEQGKQVHGAFFYGIIQTKILGTRVLFFFFCFFAVVALFPFVY